MKTFFYCFLLLLFAIATATHAQIITTVAGKDSLGYNEDNMPSTARLYNPTLLTVDAAGNILFADAYNRRVRKVNTSGIIITIAANNIVKIQKPMS